MKTIFTLNVITREYDIVSHNEDEADAPALVAALTKQDYPSVALDQGGVTHLTLDPSECPHCHRVIREHLGL